MEGGQGLLRGCESALGISSATTPLPTGASSLWIPGQVVQLPDFSTRWQRSCTKHCTTASDLARTVQMLVSSLQCLLPNSV